tara:strand:+ start:1991 stop:2176 length:186 start_codon:yes stop_codon:yes gene_type:complete
MLSNESVSALLFLLEMVLVLEDVEEDEEDVEGDLRLTGLESLVESFFLKNFNKDMMFGTNN